MSQVIYIFVAHDQTCEVPSRYIGENVALLRDVATYANELNLFVATFSLWTKRRPSTVSIALCLFVPFCVWASVPLLLAGLNVCMRIYVNLFLLTVMYHRL